MLFQSTLCQALCCFGQLYVSLYVVSVSSVTYYAVLVSSVSVFYVVSVNSDNVSFMLVQSTLCQALCCDDIYVVCFALLQTWCW